MVGDSLRRMTRRAELLKLLFAAGCEIEPLDTLAKKWNGSLVTDLFYHLSDEVPNEMIDSIDRLLIEDIEDRRDRRLRPTHARQASPQEGASTDVEIASPREVNRMKAHTR